MTYISVPVHYATKLSCRMKSSQSSQVRRRGSYSHSCEGLSIQHDNAGGDGSDSQSGQELLVKEIF